jgi:hypothetical protein
MMVTHDPVRIAACCWERGSREVAHTAEFQELNARAKVEAVLGQPLFSSDHKLILPEGTQVAGTVVVEKRAGWFHRGD